MIVDVNYLCEWLCCFCASTDGGLSKHFFSFLLMTDISATKIRYVVTQIIQV